MNETIYLKVKVNINYEEKKDRKDAVKLAKECVVSSSVLGLTGCDPKTAKLIKS